MERKIPRKNYIILAVIVFLTIVVVFYAKSWYTMTKNYNNSNILSSASEINQNELSNFILENPKFVLYASSNTNDKLKSFGSKFNDYIVNKNITDSVLYINVDDSNDLTNILENYALDNVKNNIKINDEVNIYIFENGKIYYVINDANKLSISKIDKIFKKYGMIESD